LERFSVEAFSEAEEQSGRVTASLIRTSDRNPIFLQK
jgi:hypothetical protein